MDKKEILTQFEAPAREYRGKPFWSWNGELRKEELERQVGVMKEMGLGGFFMHSRAGLITEYLGDEWFDLINDVADTGEKAGMETWLYDEDRWPSGSAGGKVTVDPQYRMKSLYIYEMLPETYEVKDDTLFLFVAKLDGINMYAYRKVEEGEQIADVIAGEEKKVADKPGVWKVLRFAIVPDPCESNYNGTTYIDTMSRKATDRFIEMTHEEYAKRCGDRLGRSIKGIFTDEPHRGHAMDNYRDENGVISVAMCWTDDLFDEFRKRYGYDPVAVLPELFYRKNGEKVAKIKLHYFDLANNLFLERFAMPINDWCNNHHIIFTGHVLHEDSLTNQTVPNGSLMRFYEHMGNPGVDVLTEHNRNYWIVKQLASAARQLGKKWMLSELYGCTGWQFNFKSHKAVGDWQALFGINVRCQHLSWYTMEGESKRDYPASILHQSPWYHDYNTVESYFARFGLVMQEGKPACDVLVINPIESVWCQAYRGWAAWINNQSPEVAPYEQRYVQLFHMLTDNQIDFDYGEEQMMLGGRTSIRKNLNGDVFLRVGEEWYRTVVVSDMLTIRPTTVAMLRAFMKAGGKVIFAGDLPAFMNAAPAADYLENFAKSGIRVPFEEKALVQAVRANTKEYVHVFDEDGNDETGVLVQARREFGTADGMAFVMLNTDRNEGKTGLTVELAANKPMHIEEWNLQTGARVNADSVATWNGNRVTIAADLDAAGTRCFVLVEETDNTLPAIKNWATVAESTVDGEFDYTCDEKDVCVLDFARWKWEDGEWHDEAEALKVDQQVRDTLGLEHRGGSMLQPWYAKLHDTKVYGKLGLEYEFYIDQMPEGPVVLAGERPEFNHYEINGVALENKDINDFWVDDCFKKMEIPAGVLKEGRNVVTIDVNFMRTTNVEALYLVGDFGVALDGHKRTLVALPEKIGCKNFINYNMPFYSGCMTYHVTPESIPEAAKAVAEGERVVLAPKHFTGGCVKVTAMGKTTVLGWNPYEADVTEAVKAGAPIDVTVVGTRRNTFGPLHQLPALDGAYGPGNFVTGGNSWTNDYSLLDSGLTGIVFKTQK